ncbi:Ca2+-binding EF-hand superfamily protein [Roseimicrobium gellanilyticum]|uniref:Ca2+-binding EF-hand superfamily protein n=1 Tax=Roseimicrobium gellanilyticum TaxID=748857 RepID=A0A366H2A8_9BACT|nr:EF-hand domain-containing protein [Roseimicrobium gellanilyticum]RBP35373.1 Ca2+-binding EF-hand superfamily protein [Roseimicrobium gellanilyticum]
MKLPLTWLALLLATIVLLPACSSVRTSTESDRDLFLEADKNKDGQLTLAEVNAMGLPRVFNHFDKNRDGTVTMEEARAVDPDFEEHHFSERDLNRDGKVSFEEYIQVAKKRGGLKKHFAVVDANSDGAINQAEANAYVEKLEAETTANVTE